MLAEVPPPTQDDGVNDMDTDHDISIVHRWTLALHDPLIPFEMREQAHSAMRVWTSKNPARASAWFAGVAWMIGQTLPNVDPWRSLSARDSVSGATIGTPPLETGAMIRSSDGTPRVFGTHDSGADLVEPTNWEPDEDIMLAALSAPLSGREAAVLAFSINDWTAGRDVLLASGDPWIFGHGYAVLRWLLWRRRHYTGLDDPFLLMCAIPWLTRCKEDGTITEPDVAWGRSFIDAEKLEDELYRPVRKIAPLPDDDDLEF